MSSLPAPFASILNVVSVSRRLHQSQGRVDSNAGTTKRHRMRSNQMALRNTPASGATNEEILGFMAEYQTQRRKCDEEQGVLRSIVKRAKAAGAPTKAMIATVAASKRDKDEVQQEMRDLVRVMSLRRIMGPQTDFFADLDLHVTTKAREADDLSGANNDGYRAGRTNVPLEDAPYDAGTEAHAAWTTGWYDGQAAIAKELGENAKVASAAKRKPGRPRKGTTLAEMRGNGADTAH